MQNIIEHINDIKIIDGHEHLLSPKMREKAEVDFFGLLHYTESDLITSGMNGLLSNSQMDKKTKYSLFLKHFKNIRNTTYAKLILLFARDLYGIQKLDEETLPELDRMVKEKSNDANWYETVLAKRAGIEHALVTVDDSYGDIVLFKPIIYFDFIMKGEHIHNIKKRYLSQGKNTFTFEDYLEYVDSFCLKCIEKYKMVAAKFALPYWRGFSLDKVDVQAARDEFKSDSGTKINFENYIFNYVIEFLSKYNMPIQFHTGHLEPAGCVGSCDIKRSRVSDFVPILLKYPNVNFVLLHCGFPYQNEYLSVVKNLPNAWADFSWIYIISPSIAGNILNSAIEMIPQNKIIGFGGDFFNVENVYAHSVIAKQVICNVLVEKVKQNYFGLDEAKEFASRILRDNPKELYKI